MSMNPHDYFDFTEETAAFNYLCWCHEHAMCHLFRLILFIHCKPQESACLLGHYNCMKGSKQPNSCEPSAAFFLSCYPDYLFTCHGFFRQHNGTVDFSHVLISHILITARSFTDFITWKVFVGSVLLLAGLKWPPFSEASPPVLSAWSLVAHSWRSIWKK